MALFLIIYLSLAATVSLVFSYFSECKYDNCIDCNWSFSCKWENKKCHPANYLIAEDWMNSVKTCFTNNIEESSVPYCKNNDNTNPPVEFSLNTKEMIGVSEVFCIWTNHDIKSKQSLRFTLHDYNENSNDKNVLLINYENNSTQLYLSELLPSYKLLLDNVDGFYFVFYSHRDYLQNQNFSLSVAYSLNYLNIFFLILGIISFCVLLSGIGAFFLLKYLKKKNHPPSSQQENNIPRIPSRDLLKQIAVINNTKQIENTLKAEEFGSLHGREEKEICTICYESFAKDSKVVVLICKHLFHYDCIHTWSLKEVLNPRCPNCNTDIIPMKSFDNIQNSNNPLMSTIPVSIFNQLSLNDNNTQNQSTNVQTNEVLRLQVNQANASYWLH